MGKMDSRRVMSRQRKFRRLGFLGGDRGLGFTLRGCKTIPITLALLLAIGGLAFVFVSRAQSLSQPATVASSNADESLSEAQNLSVLTHELGEFDSPSLPGLIDGAAPFGSGLLSPTAFLEGESSRGSTSRSSDLVEAQGGLSETGVSDSKSADHQLSNFSVAWAQMNYYDWIPTGHSPVDFRVRAHLALESASDKANWWNSACGFVFRMNARGDHYLALLGLDGWAYFYRNLEGTITTLGRGFHEKPVSLQRQADIELLVEGNSMSFFVDGEHVLTREDDYLSKGILGFALASGTNKGFGTKCEMTNVDLWDIKD